MLHFYFCLYLTVTKSLMISCLFVLLQHQSQAVSHNSSNKNLRTKTYWLPREEPEVRCRILLTAMLKLPLIKLPKSRQVKTQPRSTTPSLSNKCARQLANTNQDKRCTFLCKRCFFMAVKETTHYLKVKFK